MNLEKSLAFYKDRFADASDFTFVFVGSFDLPTIKPLVERYLASLPSLNRKEAGRDVGIRPPAGVVEKEVTTGATPKSQVGVVFTGPFQNNREEPPDPPRRWRTRSRATCSACCARTWAAPTASASMPEFAKRPTEDYRVTITFACDPARTQDLVKALFDDITQFKANGRARARWPTPARRWRATTRSTARRTATCSTRSPSPTSTARTCRGCSIARALNEQLTADAVTEAARRYLDLQRLREGDAACPDLK